MHGYVLMHASNLSFIITIRGRLSIPLRSLTLDIQVYHPPTLIIVQLLGASNDSLFANKVFLNKRRSVQSFIKARVLKICRSSGPENKPA